eukprot:4402367-Pyramimonas_sp.AAC.2
MCVEPHPRDVEPPPDEIIFPGENYLGMSTTLPDDVLQPNSLGRDIPGSNAVHVDLIGLTLNEFTITSSPRTEAAVAPRSLVPQLPDCSRRGAPPQWGPVGRESSGEAPMGPCLPGRHPLREGLTSPVADA